MTLYSFVLFVHVVSAIGLFVGLALEGFVSLRIRWARDVKEMQFFIRAFDRLRWIFVPSFVGILIGGLYLSSYYGRGTYWIPAALIATLAIMLVGGLITGRNLNQLKKARNKADETFETLSVRAKGRLLTVSYGLRFGIALGIVFLMTAKPDLWASVSALIAGCAAGFFVAAAIQKLSRVGSKNCGPWNQRPLEDASAASTR
jgi:Predicted integral membrane protein (DUF2269)